MCKRNGRWTTIVSVIIVVEVTVVAAAVIVVRKSAISATSDSSPEQTLLGLIVEALGLFGLHCTVNLSPCLICMSLKTCVCKNCTLSCMLPSSPFVTPSSIIAVSISAEQSPSTSGMTRSQVKGPGLS